MAEETKAVTIRLPLTLYQGLLGAAAMERRSLSAQIVRVLEDRLGEARGDG